MVLDRGVAKRGGPAQSPLHMARLFTPATGNDPHRVMDLPNRACPECVPDCDDVACVGDFEDRCTDQCVIVACDDPEHGDTPCSEDICESACVDPKHCLLVSLLSRRTLMTLDTQSSACAPTNSL